MSIVAWIVLGLIAGVIAESLLGGRAKHSVIITILIGIAGALLGRLGTGVATPQVTFLRLSA